MNRLATVLQGRAKQSGLLMLTSGVSLAFHFALWVWGIDHTSLTHSLLYVSITPILIAAGLWVLGKPLSQGATGSTLHFCSKGEGNAVLMSSTICS